MGLSSKTPKGPIEKMERERLITFVNSSIVFLPISSPIQSLDLFFANCSLMFASFITSKP